MKFIYLTVPKTGTTTIRHVLEDHIIIEKYLFREYANKDREKPILISIRNPWDRLVSLYFHSLQKQKYEWEKLLSNYKNFSEFVVDLPNLPIMETRGKIIGETTYVEPSFLPAGFQPQVNWLKVKNKIPNKFECIKLETIYQDLNNLIHKYKLHRSKINKFYKYNASYHKHYTEYYNLQSKKIVEEIYYQDIKLFGYFFS